MKKLVLFLYIVLFVFTACSSNISGTNSPERTFPSETQTSVVKTPELSATAPIEETSSSGIPENVYKMSCVDLNYESQLSENTIGSIVLVDDSDEFTNVIYTWEQATGIIPFIRLDPLTNTKIGEVDVSPDHTRLAYSRWTVESDKLIQAELVMVNSKGEEELVIPWDEYDPLLFQWLDNQNIVTYYEKPRADPDILVIVNPFTLEKHELLNKNSDVNYVDSINWGIYSRSRSVYDVSLERMIYIGGNGYDSILVNVQTGEKLAEVDSGAQPEWTLSGTNAITVANFSGVREDFVLISREGKLERLTNLGDYFNAVVIRGYVWSPNERHIAFWLNTYPELDSWLSTNNRSETVPFYHLAIVDTFSKTVMDYCVPAAPNYWLYAPVWSPTNNQVAVTIKDPFGSRLQDKVYLIDIANNVAIKISENMIPKGWLIGR